MADEAHKEPTVIALLIDKLDASEENLNRRLDVTEANWNLRFDQQDRQLVKIEEHTARTNGRVTALEQGRERAQGVMAAYRWIPPTLLTVLGAGLTILVMALSGGIH